MLHGIVNRIMGSVMMMERERQAQALCAARDGARKRKRARRRCERAQKVARMYFDAEAIDLFGDECGNIEEEQGHSALVACLNPVDSQGRQFVRALICYSFLRSSFYCLFVLVSDC